MKLSTSAPRLILNALLIPLFLTAAAVATAAENQWTWVKGHNDPVTTGVYGQVGVPAEINTPPGTGFGAQWVTPDGNSWIYSGMGNSNTVWKFDNSARDWAWMTGTSTPLMVVPPVHGIKGEESPLNTPGSRVKMASWADTSGSLWLYGGIDNSVGGELYGDLWKFNPESRQWTWVHGSINYRHAIYGTKGIASPDNTPGARYGSATWVDKSGNFWLFGGSGYGTGFGDLNDLWKFDMSIGQWIWVGGTQTPDALSVYGMQGVSSPDNLPCGRSDSATWLDSNGDFWLFGGHGRTINPDETTTTKFGALNDLWKYSLSTGEWTWVSGSQFVRAPTVYGTRGVPHPDNYPGGRYNLRAVVDHNDQVWIMGGTVGANELWCYNMQQNVWTWVHGNAYETLYGTYGTLGVSSPENTPGVRYGQATWLDPQGNLMLFGSYNGYGATSYGNLNDLWTLTPGIFTLPASVDEWRLF